MASGSQERVNLLGVSSKITGKKGTTSESFSTCKSAGKRTILTRDGGHTEEREEVSITGTCSRGDKKWTINDWSGSRKGGGGREITKPFRAI